MVRRVSSRPLRLVLATGLSCATMAACSAEPSSAPAPAAAREAEATPAEVAAEPAEDAAAKPPPLSKEDLALIAADPKDLTPEMRRKRAYARRRQIMQNPDSPAARALDDLAEAHRKGELELKRRDGVWFSAPGTKPKGGAPPAGWRADGPTPSRAPAAADSPAAEPPAEPSAESPAEPPAESP